MAIEIQGDRALGPDGVDRLGFRTMAERLSEALSTGTASDGLVVGVVGRWGSGKTSLLNLTQGAIDKRTEADRPQVIEFKPWLVGDRDTLLQSLFAELANGLDAVEHQAGDATNLTITRAKSAAAAIREFAANLGGAAAVAKMFGVALPWVGTVGLFMGGVADAASRPRKLPSLTTLKRKVTKRLQQIARPLIVVVDDVDRLEPAEIIEVLRLVRSVADFPNVIYVLGYDLDIVAHAVRVAARVRDGYAYTDKIVQITVPVPTPEAFDLRRWFTQELQQLKLTQTPEEERRVTNIIDVDGGRYLRTPRSVVRTLDSIRFVHAAVRDTVDLTDLVWLQLVKVGNPALFDWITNYLIEISARSIGRVSISAEDIKKSRAELNKALQRENATFDSLCARLATFLPGITSYQSKDSDEPGIFENVAERTIERAVRDRRLASPDHYRRYFTFSAPINAPTVSDYDRLAEAMDDSAAVTGELLTSWGDEKLTSGVSKTEVVLDRLSSDADTHLTEHRACNLLLALSNVMDVLGRDRVNDFGGPDVWREAERLMPRLLEAAGSQRSAILHQMFETGRSVGWLTSILRRETFAHGRYGDRPTSDRVLSSEDLDVVSAIMIARFQGFSFDEIAALPQPLSTLFAWLQAGDPEGVRQMLRQEASTDEGLVKVLEAMGGLVQSSSTDGAKEFITLSRSNVKDLLDYDEVRARVEALAAAPETEKSLQTRAAALVKNFQDGDRFS